MLRSCWCLFYCRFCCFCWSSCLHRTLLILGNNSHLWCSHSKWCFHHSNWLTFKSTICFEHYFCSLSPTRSPLFLFVWMKRRILFTCSLAHLCKTVAWKRWDFSFSFVNGLIYLRCLNRCSTTNISTRTLHTHFLSLSLSLSPFSFPRLGFSGFLDCCLCEFTFVN